MYMGIELTKGVSSWRCIRITHYILGHKQFGISTCVIHTTYQQKQ
jgi:hypothetical protein